MKVLLDPQIFWWQEYGGISKHYAQLYKFLLATPEVDIVCPLLFHRNAYLEQFGLHRCSLLIRFLDSILRFKGAGIFRRAFLNQRRYALKKIRKLDFDIFVATFYDDYFVEQLQDRPFVLTIHDLIHERIDEKRIAFKNIAKRKRSLALRAKGIITISNFTKKELVEYYPDLTSQNIKTIHHGIHRNSNGASYLHPDLPSGYILFVGKRGQYKNWTFMVQALASILRDRQIVLFCAGGGPFLDDEIYCLENLGIKELVFQKDFSEEEGYAVYAGARLFIFPSLDEGFGIPILEAMDASCPVVLSDLQVFKEVAADAALYYEKLDANALRGSVEQILNNRDLHQSLITKGLRRVKEFSLEELGASTLGYYEELL